MRSPRRRSVIQQTFTLCLLCISTLLGTEDREMRQAGISSLQDLTLREKKKKNPCTHTNADTWKNGVFEIESAEGEQELPIVCVRYHSVIEEPS